MSVRVHIPTPMRQHTQGQAVVEVGGGTVQELALSYPDRVRSLILGCTTAKDKAISPAVVTLFRLLPLSLLGRLRGNRLYGTRPIDPDLVREDQEVIAAMKVWPDGRRAQTLSLAPFTTTDRLGRLRVPTLVIHGTADRAVAYAAGVRLAGLIQGAKLVTLEGSGHAYTTDAAEEANQAVLDFLAGVP